MDNAELLKGGDSRINDSGERPLRMEVAVVNGQVIVNFAQPLTYILLPPAVARQLAASLLRTADSIKESPIILPKGAV